MPSGLSFACNMVAVSFTRDQVATLSSTDRSQMSSACRFGTTKVCPRVAGLTSRNAKAMSDSATRNEGDAPATIAQKMQSFMTSQPDAETATCQPRDTLMAALPQIVRPPLGETGGAQSRSAREKSVGPRGFEPRTCGSRVRVRDATDTERWER